jgi:hypothetical protein
MQETSRQIIVRVTPRSSRNEIVVKDGVLAVYTTSPPVDGAANDSCCEIVAKALKIGKSRVNVVKGEKSRVKTLLIERFEGEWPWSC